MNGSLRVGSDGVNRCWWCGDDELYQKYHDTEWGWALHGENKVFEKLILEGMQAGLSWITILRKRENFRLAFRNFDIDTVAAFDDHDVARLMDDAGIVRNRAKIEASVSNAQAYLAIPDFSAYLWDFMDGVPLDNRRQGHGDIPTKTPLAEKMSRDLLKRGFRFVGPTIVYAFMQACGLVNDHVVSCHRHGAVSNAAHRAR